MRTAISPPRHGGTPGSPLTPSLGTGSFFDGGQRGPSACLAHRSGLASSALCLHQLRWEPGHLALPHLLHHLLHLLPSREQLVHLLDVGAAACGDPLPPRPVDQVRHPALLRRHREHDRLHPRELALVHVEPLQLVPEARNHPEDALERAHLPQHPVTRQEVVEAELAGAHACLHRGLVLLRRSLLGPLDQGQDVAHPEDPRGHAVGVEVLELVELLADRGELHRLSGHGLHGKRGAAARVAVELGEHDATLSWKASATETASWPVMASSTSRTFVGLTASLILPSSAIRSSSIWRRPAVSTITTSRP